MASPKESHRSILDGDQKIEEKESFSHAMQLVTSIVLPMILRPLSLGFLISQPKHVLEPSSLLHRLQLRCPPRTPTQPYHILKLLVSDSVLGCAVVTDDGNFGSFQRLYSLTPMSKHFVPNEDGVSLGPFMALLQDKVFLGQLVCHVFFPVFIHDLLHIHYLALNCLVRVIFYVIGQSFNKMHFICNQVDLS